MLAAQQSVYLPLFKYTFMMVERDPDGELFADIMLVNNFR